MRGIERKELCYLLILLCLTFSTATMYSYDLSKNENKIELHAILK